jgi:uncharacterized protein (DUF885 family)
MQAKTHLVVILMLMTLGQARADVDESERLNAWLDAQYEQEIMRSPLTLTNQGRKEKYDQVDQLDMKSQLDEIALMEVSAREMREQFDYEKLSPQARISYDFWLFRVASDVSARPFMDHGYYFTQFHGWHTLPLRYLINFHTVDSDAEMQAYISRISGFGRGLRQIIQRTQVAAEKGVRPPRFAYEFVVEESHKIIGGKPFDDSDSDAAIYTDGKSKIASLQSRQLISGARALEFQNELRSALTDGLQPAYLELIAWLEKDVNNVSGEPRGVHSLPNGEAYYQHQLKYYTHSDMTAEEVHQLGLAEVKRIRAEMDEIRIALGFEGDLADLFEYVRSDSRFYHPNTDEGRAQYLDETRAYLAQMSTKLPAYFGLLPRSKLVVKRVEPYREQDGAAQFYQRGTADGSRPGVYYVHLSDMAANNLTDQETVAYHEGSPGHHMQLSIAQELTDIPKFRTTSGYSAYSEGWALYAEKLSKEMGAFEDPYYDFGRLVGEIWRAIRLVVDTGLHARGWSEEQAVQYMLANSSIPEAAVRSEIRRYLVAPGQATSYKAGMIKIQELRAEAEQRLGERFDIRSFHDVVLGGGALPLPILESSVNDWIDSTAAVN